MSILQDGAVIVDNDAWNGLIEAGAHIEVVKAFEDAWHTALVDMAERGFVFPFRVLNTDLAPSGFAFGMFAANDAGHANVCSVHPDNRGPLAWEIGTALAMQDPEAHHFYQWVRTDCRVRW